MPDDAELRATVEKKRRCNDAQQRWGRDAMGFDLYLFRRQRTWDSTGTAASHTLGVMTSTARLLCLICWIAACAPDELGVRDSGVSGPDTGATDAQPMDARTTDATVDAMAGSDVGAGPDATSSDAGPPPIDGGPPPIDAGPPPVDAGPTGPVDEFTESVTWLHPDISGWPITTELTVTFSGSSICLEYDRKNVWPEVEIFPPDGTLVVANAWVFAQDGGRWYAGTFEWMRPGQTCKAMSAVDGNHVKVRPFDEASGWRPASGVVLYFMVSGLIRNPSYRNVMERSNIVRVVWP